MMSSFKSRTSVIVTLFLLTFSLIPFSSWALPVNASQTVSEPTGSITDISYPYYVSPNTTFSVSLTVNINVDTITDIFLALNQIHPYVNEWADSIREDVESRDHDKTYTLSATAPTDAREVSYSVCLYYWDESSSDWVVMDKVNAFFITTYVPWRTLESDHIMIVFREEPPAAEYVDNAEALLQYLDQAYELLQEWTGNMPYLGLKIGIVYDSTITDNGESVGGLAGNPIQIRDYPTADTESELQMYFHELSHDFTADDISRIGLGETNSVDEGFAYFGTLYVDYRLGGDFAQWLSTQVETMYARTTILGFLNCLRDYEDAGSPFAEVRWDVSHPREEGEHRSDYLVCAFLLTIKEEHGWDFVSELFSDIMDRVDLLQPLFGDTSDLTADMNSLVYVLSLAVTSDLTSIFENWRFPLQTDSDSDGLTDGMEIAREPLPVTTISCSVSKSQLTKGDTVAVSGAMSLILLGKTVTLTYTKPDDSTFARTVTTGADGSYSDLYMPDTTGLWNVTASWEGDLTYYGASSSSMSFTVSKLSSSLSCSISSSELTIGDSTIISGSILTVSSQIPPPQTGIPVTLSYKNDGLWSTLTTVSSATDGSYSYTWIPTGVGSYQFRASWAGDGSFSGATSNEISVIVTKISTTVSCSVSSSEINLENSITVSGVISLVVSDKTVTLTYTKPDSTTVIRTVTTGSDGSYSDTYTPDVDGDWTVSISFAGDDTYEGSSSLKSFKVKKSGCLIATATYGSELSPQVQFLRGFRDNTVYNTFAGNSFMKVFNGFYYSFSPNVASVIADNSALRNIMKVVLYPLIGILHVSSAVFSVFSFLPELSVIIAGLVASSLIGIFYFLPIALIFSYFKKFKVSENIVRFVSIFWLSSVLTLVVAEVFNAPSIMMMSTGAFVLVTITTITLVSLRIVSKRLIH